MTAATATGPVTGAMVAQTFAQSVVAGAVNSFIPLPKPVRYAQAALGAAQLAMGAAGTLSNLASATGGVRSVSAGATGSDLMNVGNFKGITTFGDNPISSGAVIGSDLKGGFEQAARDIDHLAALNGAVSPGPIPNNPLDFASEGWNMIQGRNGMWIVRHASTGLQGRVNLDDITQGYSIDIPNGLFIAPGVVNSLGRTEVMNYK